MAANHWVPLGSGALSLTRSGEMSASPPSELAAHSDSVRRSAYRREHRIVPGTSGSR